jgi:hypothetical protein
MHGGPFRNCKEGIKCVYLVWWRFQDFGILGTSDPQNVPGSPKISLKICCPHHICPITHYAFIEQGRNEQQLSSVYTLSRCGEVTGLLINFRGFLALV